MLFLQFITSDHGISYGWSFTSGKEQKDVEVVCIILSVYSGYAMHRPIMSDTDCVAT